MLSEIERQEIEEELKDLPDRRSGCIDAMKVVQRQRGWVSDEALADIGELLDMTPAELDSTATFYNLIFRKPVGEHVILMCDSISCWLTGEDAIAAALKRKLGVQFGETTSDGKFTLLPTVCLGNCDQAPVMMLDGRIIGNLTEDKLDQVLREVAGEEWNPS